MHFHTSFYFLFPFFFRGVGLGEGVLRRWEVVSKIPYDMQTLMVSCCSSLTVMKYRFEHNF